MSLKLDVLALIEAKKQEAVAAESAKFDVMIDAVKAMDDGVVLPPEIEVLQAKVSELEGKLVAAQDAFEQDEVLDEEALTAEHEARLKAEKKLAAIKAALELE